MEFEAARCIAPLQAQLMSLPGDGNQLERGRKLLQLNQRELRYDVPSRIAFAREAA